MEHNRIMVYEFNWLKRIDKIKSVLQLNSKFYLTYFSKVAVIKRYALQSTASGRDGTRGTGYPVRRFLSGRDGIRYWRDGTGLDFENICRDGMGRDRNFSGRDGMGLEF